MILRDATTIPPIGAIYESFSDVRCGSGSENAEFLITMCLCPDNDEAPSGSPRLRIERSLCLAIRLESSLAQVCRKAERFLVSAEHAASERADFAEPVSDSPGTAAARSAPGARAGQWLCCAGRETRAGLKNAQDTMDFGNLKQTSF